MITLLKLQKILETENGPMRLINFYSMLKIKKTGATNND